MDHVSSIVLSEATDCPFTALSLEEALSAFGVPRSSPGVLAIASSGSAATLEPWHAVAIYEVQDLAGVTAPLLQLWQKEVPNVFALISAIKDTRRRRKVADVVARIALPPCAQPLFGAL